MSEDAETAAARLRVALGLHDLGVQMYRQRMAREHPEWDGAALDVEIQRWLSDTPLTPGRPASPERLARIRALAGLA